VNITEFLQFRAKADTDNIQFSGKSFSNAANGIGNKRPGKTVKPAGDPLSS
jgi:hypothetical protein